MTAQYSVAEDRQDDSWHGWAEGGRGEFEEGVRGRRGGGDHNWTMETDGLIHHCHVIHASPISSASSSALLSPSAASFIADIFITWTETCYHFIRQEVQGWSPDSDVFCGRPTKQRTTNVPTCPVQGHPQICLILDRKAEKLHFKRKNPQMIHSETHWNHGHSFISLTGKNDKTIAAIADRDGIALVTWWRRWRRKISDVR